MRKRGRRVSVPPLSPATRPLPHWSAPGEGMRGAVRAGPGGRWGAEDSCAVRTLAWSRGRGKAGLEDLCGGFWLNPASYSAKLRPHRSPPTPCPCGPRMSLWWTAGNGALAEGQRAVRNWGCAGQVGLGPWAAWLLSLPLARACACAPGPRQQKAVQ